MLHSIRGDSRYRQAKVSAKQADIRLGIYYRERCLQGVEHSTHEGTEKVLRLL
jgi:hypothetical protein